MAQKKYITLVIAILVILGFATLGFLFFKGNKLKQQNDEISFNRDVRPILSDKCFACHGPDANKRKVGLRLDMESGALAELPGKQRTFCHCSGSSRRERIN